MGTSSISTPFGELSRSSGQVPHVLLTRSPLNHHPCCHEISSARLACVRHAASVRPEPGSNSPSKTTRTNQTVSPHNPQTKSSHTPDAHDNWHPEPTKKSLSVHECETTERHTNQHPQAPARATPPLAFEPSSVPFSRSAHHTPHPTGRCPCS